MRPAPTSLYSAATGAHQPEMRLGAPDQGADEVKGSCSIRWVRPRGDHPNTFLALDDGRILFESGKRTVESYNPRTGTHADVLEVLETDAIGTYAGSLLSL